MGEPALNFHGDLSNVAKQVTIVQKEVDKTIEVLRLAIVDRPMKLVELENILNITSVGLRKWDKEIKSGVELSYIYSFIKEYKPEYLDKIEDYIECEIRKKVNLLRHEEIKHATKK